MANGDGDRRDISLKLSQALRNAGCHSAAALQGPRILDTALEHFTRHNVQACNDWILKHITSSKDRLSILGEYLVAVSRSQVVEGGATPAKAVQNRVHVIVIINDALHTSIHHSHAPESAFAALAPHLVELFELAASCVLETGTTTEKTLKGLVKFWRNNKLLPAETIDLLINRIESALQVARSRVLLPRWFGDANAPSHETPVSYTLEHIIRDPTRPINPRALRRRKLGCRLASQRTCDLLNEYFANIGSVYEPTGQMFMGESRRPDMLLNSLGELTKQDGDGAKTIIRASGWSSKTCEDVNEGGFLRDIAKARAEHALSRKGADGPDDDDDRYSSRSPQSRPYSSSDSEYRARRRHHRSGNSHSRSRSRSPYGSYDDRPRSRENDRDYRRRNRPSKFSDVDTEEGRRSYSRIREQDMDRGEMPPHRNTSQAPAQPYPTMSWQSHPNSSMGNNYNQHNVPPPPRYGQPHGPDHLPPVMVPPHLVPPPHLSGQFPMPPFGSGGPGGPGGFGASPRGIQGQSNIDGPYPSAYPPQMGGFHQNSYGNNRGYGGGFNHGGFQRGNYNQRGSYRGNNQRGRGGGPRWN